MSIDMDDWKKAVMELFKVPYHHLPGGTKEDHQKYQSGKLASGLIKKKPGIRVSETHPLTMATDKHNFSLSLNESVSEICEVSFLVIQSRSANYSIMTFSFGLLC